MDRKHRLEFQVRQIDCEIRIINLCLEIDVFELVKRVLNLSKIAFIAVSQNNIPQNIFKTRYLVKIGHLVLFVINILFCVHRDVIESVMGVDYMDLALITVYLTLNLLVYVLQIEHNNFPREIIMIIIDSYFVLTIRETSIEVLMYQI